MINFSFIYLVFIYLLFVVYTYFGEINFEYQIIGCFLLILLFGIPHGAIDHIVYRKQNNISNLKSQLFNNVIDNEFMYLVHSFYVPIIPETIAECNYNGFFSVAIQKNNFYGVQFHPEKSSKPGIKILENFLTI